MKISSLIMTFDEWCNFKIPLNEVIINCSVQNGDDLMLPFPIGISISCQLKYIDNLNKTITDNRNQINSKLYSLSINANTDRKRRGDWGGNKQPITRQSILNTLHARSFTQTTKGSAFFGDILLSKFVFSPEGNGIDTHRTYESLVFKCIPICEHNEDIKKKFQGLPIIYTTDYAEITTEYLNKKYEEMKNTKYDFSRLFLSFYDDDTQKQIISNGNYWVNRYPGNFGAKCAYPMDLRSLPDLKDIHRKLSFMTVTNSGYRNMTLNCLKSYNMININLDLKIFCFDKDCYEYLKDKTSRVILYEDYFGHETSYADKNWNEYTARKLDIMHSELQKYDFVLFTDGDIVFENAYFLIDAYRRMLNNPSVELFIQHEYPRSGPCSGFYIIRKTPNTLNLFSKKTLIEKQAYSKNDQGYIGELMTQKLLSFQYLPDAQYPNGNYIKEIDKKERKDTDPYLRHYNFIKGAEEKRRRMISHNRWYMGSLNYK